MSTGAGAGVNLPRGGGAIRGIGETFQSDPCTGTGTAAVPLATSPGRGGFGPALSLQYSSGNGNGPFGLGWALSIPRVTCKTEHGLPRYDDGDVFVLSGEEDLVPLLEEVVDPVIGRTWRPVAPTLRGDHVVERYRPRTESSFARIERWMHAVTSEVHWRAITREDVTSIYGGTRHARVADPRDARRVYEWLLEETFDGAGNHVLYEYACDDPALYGSDAETQLEEIYERGRAATQQYVRRVCYGNLPSPLIDDDGAPITYPGGAAIGPLRRGRRYAFEVVFDYGDWAMPTHAIHPAPPPDGEQERFGRDVPLRDDRFSHGRAGFEIRTLRRCRRVLMFHHFAELGGPTLVRSTDLDYRDEPETRLAFLAAVTSTGYRRRTDGSYAAASMPPAAFAYSEFRPDEQRYQSITAAGGDLPGLPLDDPGVALVDLFGDGLPDVVQSTPVGMRYWRNLGNGVLDRPRSLPQVPAGLSFGQPGVGFGDLGGDGQADLLVLTGPRPGFYETTADGAWQTFRPIARLPSFGLAGRGVRLVDLTGDGRSDVLQLGGDTLIWFPCLGEAGFGPPQVIARRGGDRFPDVFFDDPAGRVRIADMTGDGMSDLVFVHAGGVDYWPSHGHGRFGACVTTADAPRFGADFDPKRLFLADLDGSGCADLVYVDFDRVHFWFNRSGNSWSDRHTLAGTPPTTDLDAVQVADFYGTGTAAILWSYRAGVRPGGNYKALDPCGGVKPYVLVELSNGLGATTRITYAPSTRHFLADQADGTPWRTTLPFPVQVVDRLEVSDHVSDTRLVTEFRYHDGYYDGREREFRGFARVDRFDAERFEGIAHQVPPVETRTWFHLGRDGDDPALLPAEVDGADRVEAGRALRGAVLRTEVYGRDGSVQAAHPYVVTEHRHRIVRLQPARAPNAAVYFRHPREDLTHHHERDPDDPRTSHVLTLEVDAWGNVTRSLTVGYGRRRADPTLPHDDDREVQARTHLVYQETRYTNAIDAPDHQRAPLACEQRTYQLTGVAAPPGGRFTVDEWVAGGFARLASATELPFEAEPDGGVAQKRLIDHVRTYFRADDLTGHLPLGVVDALALPGTSHRLAATPGLLARTHGTRVTDAMMLEGGHVHSDGDAGWWVTSGTIAYSPDAADPPAVELAAARRTFFTPRRSRDGLGRETRSRHDAYALLAVASLDAVGNLTTIVSDYRTLQPFRVTDPNGNRSEVAFDMLGMVVATAIMGKAGAPTGDSLDELAADLTPAQRAAFLADPIATAPALLGRATTRIVRDLDRFRAVGEPVVTATITRDVHARGPQPGPEATLQLQITYADGVGRPIQTKVQAEPGPLVADGPDVSPRWIASGATVFDNKGNPCRQHEPFFDDTHALRAAPRGTATTLFRDPLSRPIAALRPDHAWTKIVIDPWRREAWDANDTALIADPRIDPDVGARFAALDADAYLPSWHDRRIDGALGTAEQDAARKTAAHAATPAITCADALGRPFLELAHNRFERGGGVIDERHASRRVLDVKGQAVAFVDAEGRVAMRRDHDVLGRPLHQITMDGGERWMLADATGQPRYAWDSRDQRVRLTYDAVARPSETFLALGADAERLIGRTVYGEALPDPALGNRRGRAVEVFDQAGVVTFDAYDVQGNLAATTRRFAQNFRDPLDWSTDPALESEAFTRRFAHDALGRAIAATMPDGSVVQRTFDRGGVRTIAVRMPDTEAATPFVTRIDRDVRGQRTHVAYGNQVRTDYSYDPDTSRLRGLDTTRPTAPARLQRLACTYDAVGHLVATRDEAQSAIYFDNQVVTADADYTYDAIYQLMRAQGREHAGQQQPPSWDDRFRAGLPHPGDGQALRRYDERYAYDTVGNLTELAHHASGGGWVRRYVYAEASQIDPGRSGNRLSRTSVGVAVESYAYDEHGNTLHMPHVASLVWDHHDQLRGVDLGGGGHAFYVHDGAGQRLRKIVERPGGVTEERIDLDGFELFRRRDATGAVVAARETVHVRDGAQRIALIETRTIDGGAPVPRRSLQRYQLGDVLGSAAIELDDAGRVISYEEYYPYGGTSYQAVRGEVDQPKRYRHAAKERDEETGFVYSGARYHVPWLGRWLSHDPAVITAGGGAAATRLTRSPFAYCSNDPLNRIDPDGRLDYYNAGGTFVGSDGKNDGLKTSLVDPKDAAKVQQRYEGSWLQRNKGAILGAVIGLVVGGLIGLLGGWLGVLIGVAAGGVIGGWLGQVFLRKRFLPKNPTSVGDLVGRRVDWPSTAVRGGMQDAVDRSNQKTELKPEHGPDFVPDHHGGFHEEGGRYGLVKGEQIAAASRPGSKSDPRTQTEATVMSSDLVNDPSFKVTQGKFHVHPAGKILKDGTVVTNAPPPAQSGNMGTKIDEKTEVPSSFDQPPSTGDLANAPREQHLQKWVLGAGSKEVYFYDETSTPGRPYVIKVPFEAFFRGVP